MTICAIKAKHWVLRHYLWIAIALLASALVAAFWGRPEKVEEWVAIIGIPALFLVTVQKQKTEELELFKSLFTKFNRRYDRLNEKLNAIRDEPRAPTTGCNWADRLVVRASSGVLLNVRLGNT